MAIEHKSSFLAGVNFPEIDWNLLAQANSYYREAGFIYQEVPYAIPEEYSLYTKPHNDQSFALRHDMFEHQPHELVGSAEQGFIYLAYQKKLASTKLFSISPCFRTDHYDTTHLPWFMKLELFWLSEETENCLSMLSAALAFYQQHAPQQEFEILEMGENMWDIMLNGIEVGSYGIRRLPELDFIYGTGLALPRFNQALKK